MKTLAWDVDDVLNNLIGEWFEKHWLKNNPGCKLSYEDLTENPAFRILGVGYEDYLKSLDEFRLLPAASGMMPAPEVLLWFRNHGSKFRHIGLSARPIMSVPGLAEWVFKHFGRWIRTFHFVPSLRSQEDIPVYDSSKKEYLRWLGKADILIDDMPENIEAARELGIKGVLIPRPWNSAPEGIDRALESLTSMTA